MAINPDLVNSLFEMTGGFFTWINAYTLYKQKEIKGVFIPTWLFFTTWGFWNIFYYSVLNQPLSFYAGIFLFSGNAAWVLLALWFEMKKRCLRRNEYI